MNRTTTVLALALALASLLVPAIAADPPAPFPGPALNLDLVAPIRTWDEAIPLGNGLLGGLLWGEGPTLRLSLDRGDLWDDRTPPETAEPGFTYANLQKLVRERNRREIDRLFDAPYNHPTPTKIPAGRLEVDLDASQRLERFGLDLAAAEGRATLAGGARIDAIVSAIAPVALVRIPGPAPRGIRLKVPGGGRSGDTGPDSHAVAALGYPPAKVGRDGEVQWFEQATAGPLRYVVCVGSKLTEGGTLLAVTVASTADDADPLALARRRVATALDAGYDAAWAGHVAWWRAFWSNSRIDIPERDILRQYALVQYFHGAASRPGAPPMPLQGVWTADAGTLPPWKGDYHNDLNTQMTYMGYQAAGRFDAGRSFLDFNTALLPRYRRFAREFYGTGGAAVPGVMSLAGDPLTGWPQYSLSPTMGAWVAHLYYLHWRYTADDRFLKERAYPFCRAIGESLRALLEPGADGLLKLPLSTSPEVHDNSLRAWLEPNTNYDLHCMKMLFLALAEMADAAGEPAESASWAKLAADLGPDHVAPTGALMVDAREELTESHRHLSNLMGIYPFNLITVEGGERDRAVIAASLAQWDRLGPRAWCGYSYSWMAALRARVGDAEGALRHLDVFVKAFLLRNGFHANGDQSGRGYSGMTYRPFTLEGNMLAAAAVHEMLLQSWSPTPGRRDTEVLRIFPATPWRWHDAAFDDLRAEGGHRVSARRENNATKWLRVVAGRDGAVHIRDNFGGRPPRWSREGVSRDDADFVIALKAGEAIEATLDRPAAIPPAPPDAAEPVVVGGR
jgi:alpha-L-fucosidase 2